MRIKKLSSRGLQTVFQLNIFSFLILNGCLSIRIENRKANDGLSKIENPYDRENLDEYALDVAIKLRKDFSEDPISDLFALTYGLEKIARLSELDNEQNLFHFKFSDDHLKSEEMQQREYLGEEEEFHSRRHRKKRYIENKIDLLRQDNRVEYVLPQKYLTREKRDLDFISETDLEELLDELIESENLKLNENRAITDETRGDSDVSLIERKFEKISDSLTNELASTMIKRKKEDYFKLNDGKIKKKKFNKIGSLDLPNEINFNDENYKEQWYLIDEGQFKIPLSHDLNVKEAWLNGYTGKNVTIVIIDDGLDYEHPDFFGKYRPDLSYNFNDENNSRYDPMPSTFDNQNNHGTRCAGAAAANANNSVCGVGVAYDAQVAGIKILDGPITDLLEARALTYKANDVHIRSASWGPRDDGAHMEYPGQFVNLALEEGVKNGRNGKGTLYVWASGNGGENEDDCSCDGYVSHWDIISIGSVNHRGLKPYFMELCPSTMAVVYSGGQSSADGDDDDPGVRVIASDVRGKCTSTFQGTSSAAPLAAGALALVLEANPDLGYRDVMYLIAKTSRIPNIEDTDGWIINGAKYHVNEKYGFGVLDISQMIQEAQGWNNVGPREMCETVYEEKLPEIESDDKVKLELDVRGCENIDMLEHVIANISFTFSSQGDLKMTLVSPHGTPSEILSYRKNDHSNKGVVFFPFMTLFNWGESPRGKWKLIIETRKKNDETINNGQLEHFSLKFYGIKNGGEKKEEKEEKEEARLKKRFSGSKAFIASHDEIEKIYKRELDLSQQTKIIHKRVFEQTPKKLHE